MTTFRNSQLGTVSAVGGAADLLVSQLVAMPVMENQPAVAIRVSQLAVITIVANGSNFQPLGPVVKLGCWTPCGVLMWNG
jgi:hypothetical protein